MQTRPFAYNSIAVITRAAFLARFLEMTVRFYFVASWFTLKLALEA